MQTDPRLYHWDNLRALAMFAGVLFHAALAYSPLMHPFWPSADSTHSIWIDIVVWFSHLFRMPLFFLIAGFFAARMVRDKGMGAFMRNRFMRVLLPLLMFWPLIYCVMDYLIIYAATHAPHPSSMLLAIRDWLAKDNAPSPPPGLMHLWFLYYLLWFYILLWITTTLEWPSISKWIAARPMWFSLFVIPVIFIPSFWFTGAPLPAPESFFPQWWALLLFGAYFALGCQMFNSNTISEATKPYFVKLLLASGCGYFLFFYLLQQNNPTQHHFLMQLSLAILQAFLGWWLTICSVHLGKIFLNQHNRFFRYLAQASYWTYLIHLPIVFALQFYLMNFDLPWLLKFAATSVLTFVVCLASYQIMVRHSFIGRLLNGNRIQNLHETTSKVNS